MAIIPFTLSALCALPCKHKQADPVADYIVGDLPDLKYDELYSPRDEIKPFYKGEKSYWRTREVIEYGIFEDRTCKVMIILCFNVTLKVNFRSNDGGGF